jgi:hypothetical protein
VKQHAQRTITTLGGILVSLVLTILGSGLLFWGTAIPAEHEFGREILKSFGSIIVSIGMLAFMWELFTKRSFLEETLALANMTIELKNAGIELVSTHYLAEVQWAEMLKAPPTLDFFFTYARMWCNVNSVSLGEAARMKNRTIRIVLPDPNNTQVLAELARRFSSNPADVEKGIRETTAFFEKLGTRTGEGTTVQIRYTTKVPMFSIYLMGERAVFTLYSHETGKGHVPTYVVKRNGVLYEYLEEEFTFLWNTATAAPTNQAPAAEASKH